MGDSTRTPGMPVPVLILSGSPGSGKSAVALAVHEILSNRRIPHACLDLDELSYLWPPAGSYNEELVVEGVQKLWPLYKGAGAERLVLARVIETEAALQRYADAVGNATILLCRLTASEAARVVRLRAREMGAALEWHLARSVELEEILSGAELEDFTVSNEGRSLDEVAEEVLALAGWLRGSGDEPAE